MLVLVLLVLYKTTREQLIDKGRNLRKRKESKVSMHEFRMNVTKVRRWHT